MSEPMYVDCNGVKQDERGISYKIYRLRGGETVRVDQGQPRRLTGPHPKVTVIEGPIHSGLQDWPFPIGKKNTAKRKVEVKRG